MKKIKLILSVLFGTLFAFLMVSCGEKPHVHNLVEHDRKDATCMEDGYEAYVECTTCDYTTYKVIKAKGHDFETNWSSDSEKHYHKCKNCDAKTDESDHAYSWVIDKEATEDETGLKHEECSTCHYTRNENTIIDKLAHSHSMEYVSKVDKTCTSNGNIEYYHCVKCNKNYLDKNGNNEVIDVVIKASHEYGKYQEEVNATCSKEGIKGHYECSVCHSYFDVEKNKLDSLAIAKKNHDLVHHEKLEATCSSIGYEAYDTCKNCDYTTYKEIAKKDHNYKWIVDKEATEDETGLKHEECSVCHDKKNENTIIVKLNHTHNMEHVLKVEKTCTSNGNIEYYHCIKCNKNYLDESGTNEVVDVVIKASHEYGNFINEVASTCSKEGTKGHYECNVCHSYFDANKNKLDSLTITKKSHDYKTIYSYNESKHYYECKNCDTKKNEEDHNFTWIVDKEATEEETGLKHEECNVCHYTRNENTVIDKLDHIHNMEHVLKVEKTCTSDGNIEYYHCSKCNKNYLDANGNNEVVDVIIKASHEYGNFINEVASTCSKEGIKGHYECSVCHSYFDANKKQLNSTIINKKPHNLVHHDKKEATCTSAGYEAYDTCRNCDYTTYKEIEKKPHEYSSTIKTINKETYLHYQCNNCTDSYDENCKVESSNEFDFDFENGSNVVLKNSYRNSTTSIDLKEKITISNNCTWVVSKDEYGVETYKTKVVPLNEGNNNFYIIVSLNDNNEVFTVYNLNIYRNQFYIYSFYSDGNVVLSNTIEEGETINEVPVVSKYEHSLLGWKDDNNNDVEFPYTIRNNVRFYANWKTNEYMVVFDTDGGNIVESMSIPYGTTLNLPTPVKGNDVFVGWEYNDRLYNKIEVKKDISLKATWTKDFEVRLLDDGTVEVVKYIGSDKEVNEFPKYTTIIGDYAFANCNTLINIEIPDSVIRIGKSSFIGCSNLYSMVLPFVGESKETNPYLGYLFGSDWGGSAPELPINLKEIRLLYGCERLAWGAFDCCKSLTNIEIPNSVTSIGGSAFIGCAGLKSIEIPNSVTSIGDSAFRGCSSLTNIEIPSSVKTIGKSIFNKCDKLESLTLPFIGSSNESNQRLGYLFDYNEISESEYCNHNDVCVPNSLKKVIILEGCTSIGSYAFEGCNGLTSVEIPSSVISIGWCAFSYCRNLTSINLPNGVTSIQGEAFFCCSSLISIEIPSSVTNIGNHAFYGFSSLKSIKVDKNNKIYDSRDNCNALIETASNKLILGCMNTVIPNGVISIENGAFYKCNDLTSIEIPNSVTSIGSFAFRGCSSLTSIEIPSNVASISSSAFSNCNSLKSIKVDSNNKLYASRENCNAIIETLTNTLIIGCKETIIPNSITRISSDAFNDCSSLTSIEIPSSVTNIGINAFSGCSSLASIKIDANNKIYDNRENCNAIIETSTNTLIIGCKETLIPNSVTSIGSYAFSNCSSLTSIEIPSSVISIGSSAFYGCTGLTSFIIPKSVTHMGSTVFISCNNLIIYCETSYKPNNWDSCWNNDWYSSKYKVVWNYKII